MNFDLIYGIIQIVLIATTPLVFSGIGELVTEKSGVLNLGIEGMMVVGAVTAFVTLIITGSYFLAFIFSRPTTSTIFGITSPDLSINTLSPTLISFRSISS